ncbi:MAG TPA: putative baseplate assembly protein [Anaerolineaceae bacterium]
MPLIAPKLDDRHFQDIVDEAKKRIPQYCKDWTDHNVSDPGVTLIELFAWMTDLLLYRLNQVPDRHYIKFMEMFGIKLQEPVPAKVPVTFWLSAPQKMVLTIPAGTAVASAQTETERPVVFTTDSNMSIQPPVLAAVITRTAAGDRREKFFKEHVIRRLEAGFEGLEVFTTMPQVDDAIYFGFENDLSNHILGFDVDFDPAGGAGVDPTMPPYVWEASTGKQNSRWEICERESDTSRGMNATGRILIHVPVMGRYKVGEKELYWVRARVKEISAEEAQDGMRPYKITPKLRKLSVGSWGGTTPATHAQLVTREFIGRSDGSPGQTFKLQHTPVLKREEHERVILECEGLAPQPWTEVNDFADSGPNDRHYTLDSVTGELRFGPAIRQPDGTVKLYGAIPPRGANILFTAYHFGGGQEGNVQMGVLNTLKTSIPFVSRVRNRTFAWGGLDAETLEAAMMRVPSLLRSRERAVTEADFEFLARQAAPAAIGRVKCLQPRPQEAGRIVPGQVYLLVIPRVAHPDGYLPMEQLDLKPDVVKLLTEYLDERRLLTTRLDIRAPAYYWVSVKVKLRGTPGVSQKKIEDEVLKRLYHFLNPLVGGLEGNGWQFGRSLFVSDVYQCLQGIPDVQFIRGVEMFAARSTGEPQGAPIETLEVIAHGVVASGKHSLEFV